MSQQRICSACGEAKARPETKRRFWIGVTTGLPLGEQMRFRCHGCGARFGVMETPMRAAHAGLAALGLVLFFVLMPFRAAVPIPGWPYISALIPTAIVLWAGGALALDLFRDSRNPPS